jgi:drug/metabolite transporter (DMT)-like permease
MEFWTGQGLSYGTILAILAGLILGIQVYFVKKIYIDRKENSSTLEAKGNLDILLAWFPTLFLILFFLPFGVLELAQFTWLDLIYVLILGLVPTALSFVLYNIGLKGDKGGNIIILSYFEPVVATINTVIFLQAFSIYTIIGGSLILIVNIIVLIFTRKKNEIS